MTTAAPSAMPDVPPDRGQRTCAIVVSYGERHHLLTQVLDRLATLGFGAVVVVFNGNYRANAIAPGSGVVIVDNGANLGSAGGFRAGIEAALQLNADYFLFLDDDNLPAPDCMERLLAAHAALGSGPLLALQAFRRDQPWQAIAVREGVVTIARPNTYGWFHFANERHLLRRQLGLKKPPQGKAAPRHPLLRIEVAAYGGLFLPRAALLLHELPDPRYFCYYDDLDFTARLVSRGVAIHLCADAVINDLDTSWHAREDGAHPVLSPQTPEQRLYLDLRNAFIFNRSRISSRWRYLINGVGFWLGIAYITIFRSADVRTTLPQLQLIRHAAKHGTRGEFAACPP